MADKYKLLEHNLVIRNFEVSIVYIQHIWWNIRYIRYILDIQLNRKSNENVVLNVIHFRVYWDFDGEEGNLQRLANTKPIRQIWLEILSLVLYIFKTYDDRTKSCTAEKESNFYPNCHN